MPSEHEFALLTGSSNPALANKIGDILGLPVMNPITRFSDGEICVEIPENIRRSEVFIIQSTNPGRHVVDDRVLTVNDHLKELELMVDASRRASAEKIRVVTPYFGYARQDRKDKPRRAISVAQIARALEDQKVDSMLTVDLHSEQSQGAFRGPWDHVYGSYCLIPAIQEEELENISVVSPDAGGTKRAEAFANRINGNSDLVVIYKRRTSEGASALAIAGDVEDRNVVMPDDMIASGGTMIKGTELLLARGALSVSIAATHGLFLDDAAQRILDSPIRKVFITDTVPLPQIVLDHPEKFRVTSAAELIAGSIKCIMTGDSISDKYIIR